MLHEIAEIIKKAKEEHWPYPKTFQTLKMSGVHSYQVSWKNGYSATYSGNFGEMKEPAPEGFPSMHIAEYFSKEDVKEALLRHQNGKTDYFEFLKEISAAGVSNYLVDMQTRTVTYFAENGDGSYSENVP